MTNQVSRLGLNIASFNYSRIAEAAVKEGTDIAKEPSPKKSAVSTQTDVLGFMAATYVDMVPVQTQKTVDVNKYVTKEQFERISNFVQGFESDFNEVSDTAVNELGVSKEIANRLALAYINNTY